MSHDGLGIFGRAALVGAIVLITPIAFALWGAESAWNALTPKRLNLHIDWG